MWICRYDGAKYTNQEASNYSYLCPLCKNEIRKVEEQNEFVKQALEAREQPAQEAFSAWDGETFKRNERKVVPENMTRIVGIEQSIDPNGYIVTITEPTNIPNICKSRQIWIDEEAMQKISNTVANLQPNPFQRY